LSKYFQQQSCSAINYLSNAINILVGDDPVPVKFGHKCTHPIMKDARFTFYTWSAVQSELADLVCHCDVCNSLCTYSMCTMQKYSGPP